MTRAVPTTERIWTNRMTARTANVNKAMLGGGIAAAALGSVLLLTGRKSGPSVSLRGSGVVVKHTVRF